jgi:hypothetical protein
MLICLIRDLLPRKWAKWVPSPMALSIPFYIGAASVSELRVLNSGLAWLRLALLCLAV